MFDYPDVIKHPMDLGTVEKKLAGGEYGSPTDFARDMRLIWKNCMTYNQDGSEYHLIAQR